MEIAFIIILLVVLVVIIYVAIVGNRERRKKMASDPNRVYPNPDEVISSATFVSGHPDVNESFINTYIYKDADKLILAWADSTHSPFIKFAEIPVSSIKNILIEDVSTFEKRLSLGRVLLVGVFALAWRKNKKEERAFLIISWSDGQFDHDSVFSFDKTKFFNPLSNANFSRNKLIKLCKI